MLSALLRGFAPSLSNEGTSIEQGGVVLRKEQVQRLLFHGKGDIVETKQMGKDASCAPVQHYTHSVRL
jgi:hypothetical protein